MSKVPFNVIEGQEGWLFLESDTNSSELQWTGKLVHPPSVLDRWRSEIAARIEAFSALGPIPYLFLVAPNKESVHPEFLPKSHPLAERRPIHDFLDTVSDLMPFLWPAEELKAWSLLMDVYTKVDTHWTDFGGFCLARNLAAYLPDLSVPLLADCSFRVQVRTGDLGIKFAPARRADWSIAEPKAAASRTLFDNGLTNNGRIIISEKPGPVRTRGVVFGDSFFYSVLPFLREAVDRLVFVHAYSVDLEVVAHERPSFVLSEAVERFLIEPPTPAHSFTCARHARAKMELLSTEARAALELGCEYLVANTPENRIYAAFHGYDPNSELSRS